MAEYLDAGIIRGHLPADADSALQTLQVFDEIESTNSYLMAAEPPPAGRLHVVLAEHQTAGRGRRERAWISHRASDVCLSVAYVFDTLPETVCKLTVVAGIELATALQSLGIAGVCLKWPNDLMLNNGKLGGVLSESRIVRAGSLHVVIGVGLNVQTSAVHAAAAGRQLGRKISFVDGRPGSGISRNTLCATMIDALHTALIRVGEQRTGDLAARWGALDWLSGKTVRVREANKTHDGVCGGIDEEGALLLLTPDGNRTLQRGSIELCPSREIAS